MNNDIVLELEWYFGGGAEADLGIRSVQAGFEAQMDRMALCEPRQEGQMPVRDSRSTHSASWDAMEQLDRRRRRLADARRIFTTIRALSPKDRAVLELHFGDAARLQGVSLALCCHIDTVQQATSAVNARRAKKRRPPLSPRAALELLGTSTNSVDVLVVTEIVRKAKVMLAIAMEAYSARSAT